MTEIRDPEEHERKTAGEHPVEEDKPDPCAGIADPVRRGLCKACGLPIIGEAPFCKEHEMPVP